MFIGNGRRAIVVVKIASICGIVRQKDIIITAIKSINPHITPNVVTAIILKQKNERRIITMKKNYDLGNLQYELKCVATTLSAVSYGITDNSEVEFSKASIREILFGISGYVDRIADDLDALQE